MRRAVALALFFAASLAHAQFPNHAVHVVVPFPAGGPTDVLTRALGQKLSERWSQPVVVDNKPGAGGAIGSDFVAKSAPDGYTLLMATTSTHSIGPSLQKMPYDPVKDFAPVSTVGFFGMALLVNPDSPYKSLQDFIAAAKASPGKFNVGTTVIGSTQFGAAELLKSMAGIEFQTVPFKATPAIITAVKGKDLQAMVEILAPVIPHIKSGNLRALAVTFDHRFVGLPDIPTFAESGVPGYEASAWNAIAVPAKTPGPVVARLNKEIHAAVAAPEVRQRLLELGVDPRASTPEVLRAHLVSEIAKWKAVIERAKIEKQ